MSLPEVLSEPLQEEIRLFRELSISYAGFAAEAGVEVLAFRSSDLPLFYRKSDQERKAILSALAVSVKVCEQTRLNGRAMNDTPALIWSALKEFGLRPPSDIFSRITNDSVIELHSPDGVQFFRNFNFYKYCSYTLEELFCGYWNTLYERDESVVTQLVEFLKMIYAKEISFTVPFQIPTYVVKEVFSVHKYEVEVTMEWGSPLFQEGTSSPVATLSVESAKFLSKELVERNIVPIRASSCDPSVSGGVFQGMQLE